MDHVYDDDQYRLQQLEQVDDMLDMAGYDTCDTVRQEIHNEMQRLRNKR